ncbi:O-methyltransferase involved in polyketide biosynthesis [Actinomadura pelletieri DSM 43383]|uniref:O-methyltransferase involved in polyketide biosynthesis n=1 Tax=Actinomadura pelletieri DSM 43383 TaxID=1120940 RepID=A0A495QX67_9ACTN|nr:SAM-dependent methyltransferase [Actinomadura pelletieri]RKS78624.1 O-methyltransferase involved in polyketide biosynthesis [Actinomadura pelletieri DSM 43383]
MLLWQADELTVTSKINSTPPNSARVWDYWLGGKDNYPADRDAGDKAAEILPEIIQAARHDRAFLSRVVRYLADDVGIRQFLDVGAGMPAAVDNTHQVAQRVAPDARVVYVDHDALVLAHARALLTGTLEGACDHIDADARDVETIVCEAARTLDLAQPVALLLLDILNYIVDDTEAQATVEGLVAALAPGSHVVIAHPTASLDGERAYQAMQVVMDMGGAPVTARTPQQIADFFDGLELLDPGVVSCSHWRTEPWPPGKPVLQYCGVARVPDREAGR